MESLIDKITRLLLAGFPDANITIERAVPGAKLGGLVVWGGFDGNEQVDRQLQVRQLLRSKLTPEELLQVTAILTLTPAENRVMQEN